MTDPSYETLYSSTFSVDEYKIERINVSVTNIIDPSKIKAD